MLLGYRYEIISSLELTRLSHEVFVNPLILQRLAEHRYVQLPGGVSAFQKSTPATWVQVASLAARGVRRAYRG